MSSSQLEHVTSKIILEFKLSSQELADDPGLVPTLVDKIFPKYWREQKFVRVTDISGKKVGTKKLNWAINWRARVPEKQVLMFPPFIFCIVQNLDFPFRGRGHCAECEDYKAGRGHNVDYPWCRISKVRRDEEDMWKNKQLARKLCSFFNSRESGIASQPELHALTEDLRSEFGERNIFKFWESLPILKLGHNLNQYLTTSGDRDSVPSNNASSVL